jgi:N-acetylglucosaminyl-diphospho-decaprenol L-rhamnosyltransferase
VSQPPLDLSVVVLNYNTREHLRACLTSLHSEGSTTLAQTDAPITAELLVVDNASSDGSADMVAAEFPGATLIRSPFNGGFAYGNNRALRRTRGRAVLLLNPDTEVPHGAIGSLLRHLDAHPEAAVIGPKLVRADGSMHRACRRAFPSPSVALYRLAGLDRLFPRSRIFGRYNLTYLDPDLEMEVDAVCGACMLVRREAIDQVGVLDERFFMYGEDLDWCWRMKEAGWTVRYVPGVVVRHQHGAAGRQQPLRATFHFFRAMDLFYRKHYARRYNPVVTAAVVAGIYTALAVSLVRLALTPGQPARVGL